MALEVLRTVTGITELARCNPRSLFNRCFYTLLNQNVILDSDTFGVFQNLSMAENSFNLCSCQLRSVLTQQSETLLVLKRLGAW